MSQKVGYDSDSRYKTEQRRALSLIQCQRNLIKDATAYDNSYNNATNKTVLHYRDYLIAQATTAFVFNTQFTSDSRLTLTQQAQRAWSVYSFDDFWAYVPPDPTQIESPAKYWGELGTLAFYLQYVNQAQSLPLVLQSGLEFVWSILGGDYTQTASQRATTLLIDLDLQPSVIQAIIALANFVFSLKQSDSNYSILQACQRYNIVQDDYNLLLQRILLGEYNNNQFDVLTALLNNYQQTTLATSLNDCLMLLRPSGMELVLQAYIAEAYLSSAIYLSNLTVDLQAVPLSTFIVDATYAPQAFTVAQNLALAYDAYSMLNLFTTRADATQQMQTLSQQILSWASSSKMAVSATGGTRLAPLLP